MKLIYPERIIFKEISGFDYPEEKVILDNIILRTSPSALSRYKFLIMIKYPKMGPMRMLLLVNLINIFNLESLCELILRHKEFNL